MVLENQVDELISKDEKGRGEGLYDCYFYTTGLKLRF